MKQRLKISRFINSWFLSLALLSSLIFMQCTTDNQVVAPDVSDINISTQFFRLDSIFALSDKNQAIKEVEVFQERHPEFSELYFKQILRINATPENPMDKQLEGFLTSDQGQSVTSEVANAFPNLKFLKEDLEQSLKYYKFYFPDQETPSFYTFLSEYAYQLFLFDDGGKTGVAIGLDLFLAPEKDYKSLDPRNPAFSDYLTKTYTRDYIVKKIMEALIDDQMGEKRGSSLLSQMILEGKKSYILKKLMPFAPETILLEQQEDGLKWMQENELEMWSFFLEEDLLYKTSARENMKYIKPRPDSPGMPEQAPGKTGVYLGMKIVKDYMDKNPSMSIGDLLKDLDPQKLLDAYRPRRK